MHTIPPAAPDRVTADTQALLRLLAQGGTLGRLHGLTDDELEALYAFGQQHYAQGRYAEALKVFARLVSLHHGQPRYLNALASAHRMLGHHEQAVHYWGVSQLLDPSDPAPTFHTAGSLLALGFVDDALDALDITLRQCGERPERRALKARAAALQALVRARSTAAQAAA